MKRKKKPVRRAPKKTSKARVKKMIAVVEKLRKSRDPEVQRAIGKIAHHLSIWADLQLKSLPIIEESAMQMHRLFDQRLQELQNERYDVMEIADMVATVVGAGSAFEDGQAGLETALEYYEQALEKLANMISIGPRT